MIETETKTKIDTGTIEVGQVYAGYRAVNVGTATRRWYERFGRVIQTEEPTQKPIEISSDMGDEERDRVLGEITRRWYAR